MDQYKSRHWAVFTTAGPTSNDWSPSLTQFRNSHAIRRAELRDIAGIQACLEEAFGPYQGEYPPLAFKDTVPPADVLIERFETMMVFVAADDAGRTIGTISASVVDGDEGHLRGMAVVPRWQGSRVAAELLDHALDALRAAGCSRVTLDTTSFLERAILFYRANGFEPTGRTKDFFGIPLYEFSRSLARRAIPRERH